MKSVVVVVLVVVVVVVGSVDAVMLSVCPHMLFSGFSYFIVGRFANFSCIIVFASACICAVTCVCVNVFGSLVIPLSGLVRIDAFVTKGSCTLKV